MSIPESYIKDIAISISDKYRFDNSPVQPYKAKTFLDNQLFTMIFRMVNKLAKSRIEEEEDIQKSKKRSYIGRLEIREKFLHFLHNGSGKGVFMVTGYRGMGKTSFVNTVLNEYSEKYKPKSRWKKWISLFYIIDYVAIISITMAQKQPKDTDVLRLMLIKVYEEAIIHSFRNFIRKSLQRVVKLLLILLIVPTFCFFFQEQLKEIFEPGDWIDSFLYNVGIYGLIILGLLIIFIVLQMIVSSSKTIEILRPIYDRCYASSSIVKGQEEESFLITLLNKIFSLPEMGTRNYQAASAKEIEMALISYLERSSNEYIFIFDELDKMEPEIVDSMLQDDQEVDKNQGEKSFHEQIRERKQAIIYTIASLKNFLTTAKARFVFIAGREMFEATLADIADRQSSLGSMFNYVFYVESFLKENLKSNRGSLSSSIEAYIMYVLYNKTHDDKGLYQLTRDTLLARATPVEVVNKTVVLLQNFVIYLTYRSNGSPQKIIKAVHEFIKKEESLVNADDEDGRETVDLVKLNRDSKMYLSFNYNDQYRIGFINYLYRPFLIEYGRSFKKYSDGIVASVPYLFDHLLKFHPFAFSVLHLELIPEVMSVNKVPSVREHIKNIIEYLTNKHIKETEIGLFEYRFLRRTVNEITMMSKTFEAEAAAFNFTLDESYAIKSYVKNKIRFIENNNIDNSSGQGLFSVSYLQNVLGDIYFFDQEYFDAVIAYADSIKVLEREKMNEMNVRDFFTLINTRLKLGLAFERMRSYGEALAIYTDAIKNVKQFFTQLAQPDNPLLVGYDLLQLVNQCFLANIMVQEKMGIAGGTICNVYNNLHSFFELANLVGNKMGKNCMVLANALLQTGNILYFKNHDRIVEKRNNGQLCINEHVLSKLDHALNHAFNGDFCTGDRANIDVRWSVLSFYLLGLKYIFESSGIPFVQTSNTTSTITEMLAFLENPAKKKEIWDNKELKKNEFKYIGNFLSNIGDVLFAGLKINNRKMKLDEIFDRGKVLDQVLLIKTYFDERLKRDDIAFPKTAFLDSLVSATSEYDIISIFKCYFFSGYAYIKRGRKQSASFQYKKILDVLKKTLEERENGDLKFVDNVLYIVEHTLVRPIILMVGQNNNHTDEHMKMKFLQFLELDQSTDKGKFLSYNISFHMDIKDADTMIDYLRIKLGRKPKYYSMLVGNYVSMGTQHNRIIELDLSLKYNSRMVTRINRLWERYKASKWKDELHERCKEYYSNYLYSMLAIIKILEIYDSVYVFGFSYPAYIHYQLGLFLSDKTGNKAAKDEIIQQVGKLPELNASYTKGDHIYHFKKAKNIYLKVFQLHGEGVAYVHAMKDMLYLEDDINDTSFHFAMAIERFLERNGDLKRHRDTCDRHIKEEKVTEELPVYMMSSI
jgi:Cdc6-like AAA superfamily ATPase